MITLKGIKKEFNREYGNLVELHRRIFDKTKTYPINVCIDWFIDGAKRLMEKEDFQIFLNENIINSLINMGKEILRVDRVDNDVKKELSLVIKNLQVIQNSTTISR